jgi:hypothetical protein
LTNTKIPGFERAEVLAPLVVGIAGHLDIREEDRQRLEDKVRAIFLELHKDYGATPLIIVSALAEGADRLAAEVALSVRVGVRLVVPLPMPVDLYEMDFDRVSVLETPTATVVVERNSREEFRALLDRAEAAVVLKLATGNTLESIAEQGPPRDLQYEAVGKYIARQSQILVALWDGVESNLVGGTSSVVRFQKQGVPGAEICELEAPEGFPVYHILTPRQKNPYPLGKALELRKIYPAVFEQNDAKAEKYYGKMFARLNEFNKYVADPDSDLAEGIVTSRDYLLQDMPQDELPDGMGAALNRYAVADALAIRFQKQLLRAQVRVHAWTFIAFLFFLLFVDLPPFYFPSVHLRPFSLRLIQVQEHWIGFLFVSGILLFATIGLSASSGKRALDTQHEDYRAMAEGLRVKFFWKLAGVRDQVAEHYLGKQRSELDWIRNGFRGWNVAEAGQNDNVENLPAEEQRDRLGFARKYWIDNQQAYFKGAAERNLKYHENFERFGKYCIIAVSLLGTALAILRTVNYFELFCGSRYVYSFSLAVIALEALLAAAAISHHFDNRLAYGEHAKQYQRMASLFARGSELLRKFLDGKDYENGRVCVKKVGNEALTENGDWVLLRRERPLEVPHP